MQKRIKIRVCKNKQTTPWYYIPRVHKDFLPLLIDFPRKSIFILMKTNYKAIFAQITHLVVISAALFLSISVYGQGGPGDPGGEPDNPGIPLDGGLSILIAAGAAYGGKKLYDANKRTK